MFVAHLCYLAVSIYYRIRHVIALLILSAAGFIGANIYMRALFALQSGEPAEIRYALHHLVKISHERGDKYLFEQFPGLAEALLEHVLRVSSLFYDVKWRISYDDEPAVEDDVLNALNGTPNIMPKLRALRPLPVIDGLQPEDFATTISNVSEAGLVLRNMVMLEHNASYLVRRPLLRDLLVIILNLPDRPVLTELRHYGLDIAEQITRYFSLRPDDPLYTALLSQLESDDRGAVITALRALSRIAMNYETTPNRLANVPVKSLNKITEWLLVEDEEMRSACLDFLYQYTAITDNVEYLLKNIDMEGVVGQLVRLLLYGAQAQKEREEKRTVSSAAASTTTTPPKLSPKIIETLIQTIQDERELSSAWYALHPPTSA
jgi:chromatin structure-remodeling complex subunit RSC9